MPLIVTVLEVVSVLTRHAGLVGEAERIQARKSLPPIPTQFVPSQYSMTWWSAL